MIDEKSTDGTSTSKKDQDGHGTMKSKNFFRDFAPKRRIEYLFVKMVMNVEFFFDKFSRQVFKVSCTCGSNYSVFDGCVVYTHSSVARTFSCT